VEQTRSTSKLNYITKTLSGIDFCKKKKNSNMAT